MDFTFKILPNLYNALQSQGFSFITFSDYLQGNLPPKYIILRHDVEKHYENALKFAKIQNKLNIKGVYYFRISGKHFNPEVVKQIAALGHETGYHYDDLTQCKGNYDLAIKRFEKNLNLLRKIAPVKTICMDGAPLSRYDNRDLWRRRWEEMRGEEMRDEKRRDERREMRDEKLTAHHSPLISHHYRDFDILGEPYFDIDFNEVFYLTDTGRLWDGGKVSVRDKVGVRSREYGVGSREKDKSSIWSQVTGHWSRFKFHSTQDVIDAITNNTFPQKAMITFHPQRWTDKPLPWVKELVMQRVKNGVKYWVVKIKDKRV